jgi:immunity protein 27 of polymorphic toxin system
MNCICQETSELEGNEALDYIEDDLHVIDVNDEIRQTLYVCPITRLPWLKDYPNRQYPGGGSPRLSKISMTQEN